MEIRDRNQYNQSIGRYKILSSAAGVGAVITTKWGGFIMPLSISDWKFIQVLSKRIEDRPDIAELKLSVTSVLSVFCEKNEASQI